MHVVLKQRERKRRAMGTKMSSSSRKDATAAADTGAADSSVSAVARAAWALALASLGGGEVCWVPQRQARGVWW